MFFFLPAKIYGALLHLMACWSISGHICHIYFPDCPLFLDFFFFIDPPFLYILFSPCSFCSSVRQIFWRHCCGWNIIYLYFDLLFWTRFVIFFTNLSLYSQIYWLSGFIFPVIILSTDIVWALVITYFNWQCSILYRIRVVHIPK